MVAIRWEHLAVAQAFTDAQGPGSDSALADMQRRAVLKLCAQHAILICQAVRCQHSPCSCSCQAQHCPLMASGLGQKQQA